MREREGIRTLRVELPPTASKLAATLANSGLSRRDILLSSRARRRKLTPNAFPDRSLALIAQETSENPSPPCHAEGGGRFTALVFNDETVEASLPLGRKTITVAPDSP